jgi:integrase
VDLESEVKTLRVVDNTRSAVGRDDRTVTSTKTHRDRVLPVHPELLKVLQGLPHHDDGRVFHGPLGGKIKPDKVRTTLLKHVLEPLQAKFPGQAGQRSLVDGRLHSFRHFFCSKCARDGVDQLTVKTWLGHRDSRMVAHYYHLHDEDAQRQMHKLNSVGGPGAT